MTLCFVASTSRQTIRESIQNGCVTRSSEHGRKEERGDKTNAVTQEQGQRQKKTLTMESRAKVLLLKTMPVALHLVRHSATK